MTSVSSAMTLRPLQTLLSMWPRGTSNSISVKLFYCGFYLYRDCNEIFPVNGLAHFSKSKFANPVLELFPAPAAAYTRCSASFSEAALLFESRTLLNIIFLSHLVSFPPSICGIKYCILCHSTTSGAYITG
ncbi:hypothetical protein D3C74_176920 [compost metagenome]